MRHVIDAIAAQGRNGDDTLMHVSKDEVRLLKSIGDRAGVKTTINPKTGLPEAFNWWGTLGGIAGGALGTLLLPGVGTAVGAGLGSAAGTAAGGGTTEQALMSGVLGGITGYAGAGIASGLAEAGAQAGAQAATQGAAEVGTQAAGQAVTQAGTEAAGQAATQAGTEAATQATTQAATDTGSQTLQGLASEGAARAATGINTLMPQASGAALAEGATSAPTQALASTPMSYGDKLVEGFKATPTKDLISQYGSKAATGAMGAYGLGSMQIGAPEPIAIPGEEKKKTQYKAEYYQGPGGEIRTRAVPMAQGGLAQFAGYDAAEIENDGYTPGGTITYAEGGVTSIPTDTKAGYSRAKTGPVLPEGFFSAEEYANATPEERATMEQLMQAEREFIPSPMRRTGAGYAMGGIASMAKGRYLQGPGDGMSDSIESTIDGKQPARLATGEFVVPADVVSHLGNGDSTAGAKQLHAMMDRARMSRTGTKKQGKQINPRKVMPA